MGGERKRACLLVVGQTVVGQTVVDGESQPACWHRLGAPVLAKGQLFWLAGRPSEQGRQVICRWCAPYTLYPATSRRQVRERARTRLDWATDRHKPVGVGVSGVHEMGSLGIGFEGTSALGMPGGVLAARWGSNQWTLRRRASGTCARASTSTAAATSSSIIRVRTPSSSSATTQTNACTDRASLRTLAIRYDANAAGGAPCGDVQALSASLPPVMRSLKPQACRASLPRLTQRRAGGAAGGADARRRAPAIRRRGGG